MWRSTFTELALGTFLTLVLTGILVEQSRERQLPPAPYYSSILELAYVPSPGETCPEAYACPDGYECIVVETTDPMAPPYECVPVSCTPPNCDDGNVCTEDICSNNGCLHSKVIEDCCVSDDECVISDPCWATMCMEEDHRCFGMYICCDDGDPCTYDAGTSAEDCEHYPIEGCAPDCDDDGDPCTSDFYDGMDCHHDPIAGCCTLASECNDNNSCTTDACSNGSCSHTNNTASCNDNNACTTNDVCGGGSCTGSAKNCNDSNSCTDDSCNTTSGQCVHTPNSTCECVNATTCNDNNSCTTDACSNGSCSHTNNTASCNDNNACTTNDVCGGGSCTGSAKNCNDSNSCTDDSCNTTSGQCVHTPNSTCECVNATTCNDNNSCTTDACSNGKCTHEKTAENCCETDDDCESTDECWSAYCDEDKQCAEIYICDDASSESSAPEDLVSCCFNATCVDDVPASECEEYGAPAQDPIFAETGNGLCQYADLVPMMCGFETDSSDTSSESSEPESDSSSSPDACTKRISCCYMSGSMQMCVDNMCEEECKEKGGDAHAYSRDKVCEESGYPQGPFALFFRRIRAALFEVAINPACPLEMTELCCTDPGNADAAKRVSYVQKGTCASSKVVQSASECVEKDCAKISNGEGGTYMGCWWVGDENAMSDCEARSYQPNAVTGGHCCCPPKEKKNCCRMISTPNKSYKKTKPTSTTNQPFTESWTCTYEGSASGSPTTSCSMTETVGEVIYHAGSVIPGTAEQCKEKCNGGPDQSMESGCCCNLKSGSLAGTTSLWLSYNSGFDSTGKSPADLCSSYAGTFKKASEMGTKSCDNDFCDPPGWCCTAQGPQKTTKLKCNPDGSSKNDFSDRASPLPGFCEKPCCSTAIKDTGCATMTKENCDKVATENNVQSTFVNTTGICSKAKCPNVVPCCVSEPSAVNPNNEVLSCVLKNAPECAKQLVGNTCENITKGDLEKRCQKGETISCCDRASESASWSCSVTKPSDCQSSTNKIPLGKATAEKCSADELAQCNKKDTIGCCPLESTGKDANGNPVWSCITVKKSEEGAKCQKGTTFENGCTAKTTCNQPPKKYVSCCTTSGSCMGLYLEEGKTCDSKNGGGIEFFSKVYESGTCTTLGPDPTCKKAEKVSCCNKKGNGWECISAAEGTCENKCLPSGDASKCGENEKVPCCTKTNDQWSCTPELKSTCKTPASTASCPTDSAQVQLACGEKKVACCKRTGNSADWTCSPDTPSNLCVDSENQKKLTSNSCPTKENMQTDCSTQDVYCCGTDASKPSCTPRKGTCLKDELQLKDAAKCPTEEKELKAACGGERKIACCTLNPSTNGRTFECSAATSETQCKDEWKGTPKGTPSADPCNPNPCTLYVACCPKNKPTDGSEWKCATNIPIEQSQTKCKGDTIQANNQCPASLKCEDKKDKWCCDTEQPKSEEQPTTFTVQCHLTKAAKLQYIGGCPMSQLMSHNPVFATQFETKEACGKVCPPPDQKVVRFCCNTATSPRQCESVILPANGDCSAAKGYTTTYVGAAYDPKQIEQCEQACQKVKAVPCCQKVGSSWTCGDLEETKCTSPNIHVTACPKNPALCGKIKETWCCYQAENDSTDTCYEVPEEQLEKEYGGECPWKESGAPYDEKYPSESACNTTCIQKKPKQVSCCKKGNNGWSCGLEDKDKCTGDTMRAVSACPDKPDECGKLDDQVFCCQQGENAAWSCGKVDKNKCASQNQVSACPGTEAEVEELCASPSVCCDPNEPNKESACKLDLTTTGATKCDSPTILMKKKDCDSYGCSKKVACCTEDTTTGGLKCEVPDNPSTCKIKLDGDNKQCTEELNAKCKKEQKTCCTLDPDKTSPTCSPATEADSPKCTWSGETPFETKKKCTDSGCEKEEYRYCCNEGSKTCQPVKISQENKDTKDCAAMPGLTGLVGAPHTTEAACTSATGSPCAPEKDKIACCDGGKCTPQLQEKCEKPAKDPSGQIVTLDKEAAKQKTCAVNCPQIVACCGEDRDNPSCTPEEECPDDRILKDAKGKALNKCPDESVIQTKCGNEDIACCGEAQAAAGTILFTSCMDLTRPQNSIYSYANYQWSTSVNGMKGALDKATSLKEKEEICTGLNGKTGTFDVKNSMTGKTEKVSYTINTKMAKGVCSADGSPCLEIQTNTKKKKKVKCDSLPGPTDLSNCVGCRQISEELAQSPLSPLLASTLLADTADTSTPVDPLDAIGMEFPDMPTCLGSCPAGSYKRYCCNPAAASCSAFLLSVTDTNTPEFCETQVMVGNGEYAWDDGESCNDFCASFKGVAGGGGGEQSSAGGETSSTAEESSSSEAPEKGNCCIEGDDFGLCFAEIDQQTCEDGIVGGSFMGNDQCLESPTEGFNCGPKDSDSSSSESSSPETPCGNGTVDEGEECDEGSQNSNSPNATCRADCTAARCGDGIQDANPSDGREKELCDDGEQNSDTGTATCKLNCKNRNTFFTIGNWLKNLQLFAVNGTPIPDAPVTSANTQFITIGVLTFILQ